MYLEAEQVLNDTNTNWRLARKAERLKG